MEITTTLSCCKICTSYSRKSSKNVCALYETSKVLVLYLSGIINLRLRLSFSFSDSKFRTETKAFVIY